MEALLHSRSERYEEEAGWPSKSRESTLVIRFTSEEPGLYGPGFVPSTHSRFLQSRTRWQFQSGEGEMQSVEDVSQAQEAVLAELRVSWAFRSRQAKVESRYWTPTIGE